MALPPLVDMAGILTHLANNAFTADPDSMLSKDKNFYWRADIAEGRCPDGVDGFQAFVNAPPGAPNLGSAALARAAPS